MLQPKLTPRKLFVAIGLSLMMWAIITASVWWAL